MAPRRERRRARARQLRYRHARASLAAFVAALAMTCWAFESRAAVFDPIATSGHDVDILFEVGLAAGQAGANSEIGSRQFYEQGVSTQTAAHKSGLTQTVTGTSASGANTVNFTFEPFELNNALKFGAGVGAKTLTLEAPGHYSDLAIVLSAGSLNGNSASGPLETASVPYTINYAGGTTQTGTVFVADWSIRATVSSSRTEKLISVGRIGASPPPLWPQTPEADAQADRWNVFFHRIELSNPEANVLSVQFGPVGLDDADGQLNADDDVVIFGLSGVAVLVPSLTVEVNTTTGLVRFKNPTDTMISFTGYEISSAAGSLNLAGWHSLAAQNLDAVDGPDAGVEAGDSPGESWSAAAGSSNFAMQEGFLLGSSPVVPGGWLSLGAAYNTSIDARDLVVSIRKADSSIVPLAVEYVEESVPGDFDGDRDVDGDDLALWKANFGSATAEAGDADGDGDADGSDFLVWQQSLSPPPAGSLASATPEPTAIGLTGVIMTPLLWRRRHSRPRHAS